MQQHKFWYTKGGKVLSVMLRYLWKGVRYALNIIWVWFEAENKTH